jgi:predicted nucleotidyltransferase
MFYLELFREMQRNEVRYLLVGGVAVNLHGAERMTMDVDLMIAQDASNLPRYVEGVEISVASIGDLVALKSGTGRAIDASDIRALHRLEMLRSRERDDG